MDTNSNESETPGSDFYFARLSLILALRKTHGRAFTSAFLEEFPAEIWHAFNRAHSNEQHKFPM